MKITKLLCKLFLFTFIGTTTAQESEVAIYVSDAGNFNNPPWQILKFDQNGENPEVFIDDDDGHIAWPQDIVFLENEPVVLISSLNSGLITKHNATTGEFIENFASGIGGPTRMKIGPENLLYVLQWQGNGTVFRYELDGTFVDEFTNIGVPQSIGIDWDSDGNLYISSFTGDSVEKFDTNGVFIETFINSNLVGPTNIWFEENGDLIVIDYNGGAVKRFDSEGNFLGIFIDGISFAEGVEFFPEGDILIGDGNNSAVNRYADDGTFIETFIESGAANLLTPNAIVRRETTLATESFSTQNITITPTVGTTFTIDTATISKIGNMTIHNALGQQIDSIKYKQLPLTWDAHAYAEGIYFIKIIGSDGSQQSQKVIVKK
ncbi:T9SS type A sorting domain-containing protein [uncultured Dokdonia sp.]|uniref:T9SS type A sorting domain-containing protein n=1 Tax=uncultured Dokdonia sp. TaxID=575653 RepID=UPI00261A4ED9|nr:T9SS type A sorting domain-containing protein [uncultured Dokdonia sp.]